MKGKQELQETAWHTKDSKDVLSEFETDEKQGLSGDEPKKRRDKYGPNKIRTGEKKPWYVIRSTRARPGPNRRYCRKILHAGT